MTDDREARELIQRSRRALRPTVEDRARIEAALRAQLGAAAFDAGASAAPPSKLGLKLASGAAICACVLATVAFLGRTPSAPQPPAPPRSVPALPTPPPSPPEPATPPSAAPVTPAKPVVSRKHDSLAQEVALLSNATRLLRAGDVSAALRVLDEHKRKYPQGVLREERRAARAQVLCSIGRVSEGNAELVGLPPQSPTVAQAEQVCRTASTGQL